MPTAELLVIYPGVETPRTTVHTVYLVTAQHGAQLSEHQALLSDATDLIGLCWRAPCEEGYAGDFQHPGLELIFMPNGTWTSHRNRLLRVAQARDRRLNRPYTYYTFLDGQRARMPRSLTLRRRLCARVGS